LQHFSHGSSAFEPAVNMNTADYIPLAHLYVFVEKVQDVRCRNDVVDTILAIAQVPRGGQNKRIIPNSKTVKIIYNGTTEQSPARHLLSTFSRMVILEWS